MRLRVTVGTTWLAGIELGEGFCDAITTNLVPSQATATLNQISHDPPVLLYRFVGLRLRLIGLILGMDPRR